MKVCTCFLLFRIFAYTNSSPLYTSKGEKHAVDVDLDGVLKLYVGKNHKNVSDKRMIENKISRRDSKSPSIDTFTDFVQEVIKILNTYDDKTFEEFFHILDKEIKKYHYRGYKYHELMEIDEFRSFIDEKFDSINGKSVSFIKNHTNEVTDKIKHKTYDKNVEKLVNYVNSVYKENDKEKFQKVLTDLKTYGNSNHEKPKTELIKIIRLGLWTIIFNHYTNLNNEEKQELKKEITVFLKQLNETQSPNFKTQFIHHKPAVSELETTISNLNNETTKVNKGEILKQMNPTSTTVQKSTPNKRRHNLRRKTIEERTGNKQTTFETSTEEESSQQLTITFESTDGSSGKTIEGHFRAISTDTSSDETVQGTSSESSQERHRKLKAQPYNTLYIENFYGTSKKPEAIYKPEMESNVVEGMSIEESTDRLPTTQSNTKRQRQLTPRYPAAAQKQRVFFKRARPSRTTETDLRYLSENNLKDFSDRDLRRSIAPPLPNDDLSIEVFDKERRQREKALADSYSFVRNNSIQHGLKDYLQKRRNLVKTIQELKEIYENNHRSKVNVTTYNGDFIKNMTEDFEVLDKYYKDKDKQLEIKDVKDTKVVNEKPINMYEVRAQTEVNEFNTHEEGAQTEKFEFNTHEVRAQTEKNELNWHEARAQTEKNELNWHEARAPTEKNELNWHEARAQTEKNELNWHEARAQTEKFEFNTHEVRAQTEKFEFNTHEVRAQTEKNEINTHEVRAQTEKNKLKDEDTTEGDKKTNTFNVHLQNSKETAKNDGKHELKSVKPKMAKRKKIRKATNTKNIDKENKYSKNSTITKLYDLKSVKIPVYIELLTTAKKIMELSETTFKTTKKIDNTI